MMTTPYDQIAGIFSALRRRLHPREAQDLSLQVRHFRSGSDILNLGCGTADPIAAYIASREYHDRSRQNRP